MAAGPAPEEDDDDSVYSQPAALPLRGAKNAKEIVLEPHVSQPLDDALDEEDAAYLRDNPPESDYDSDGRVTLSDDGVGDVAAVEDLEERDSTEVTSLVHELPTPHRMPADDCLVADVANPVRDGASAESDQPGRPVSSHRRDDDDDDWFDSDENKVDVESLASSDSSTGLARGAAPAVAEVNSFPLTSTRKAAEAPDRGDRLQGAAMPTVKKTAPAGGGGGGGGGFSLLTRASQTFYKAFKKSSKKSVPPATAPSTPKCASGNGGNDAKAEDMEHMHKRVEQLLEAQIATLNGAKTGFVDVRLLQPMTEKTLEAVEKDAVTLLCDFGELERRTKELDEEARKAEREAEKELAAKEQMLIEAKVRLAEAAAEVDSLRHELRSLERELERPERVEMRKRVEQERKRERLKQEATVVGEAREAAERRLGEQKQSLGKERAGLERLESGFRDIEGDWA